VVRLSPAGWDDPVVQQLTTAQRALYFERTLP
jgi:hypothetical protein